MIDVNETYLVEALVSIGVSEKEVQKVLKRLRGCRIYIRDRQKEEIIDFVCKKIKQGVKRSEAIRYAAMVFEKSENRIREIIRGKCGKN